MSHSHLPSEILVVSVSHIQALGGEGVGLDLDIRTGDFVDEAGLADIWETLNYDLLKPLYNDQS